MNNTKLSICMMVKNEENNLGTCLTSIQNTCARKDVELIIIDTGSNDATVEIAREYTENVYFHEWNNNFAEMRNKSISYAKGEWILILDADEEVEDETKIASLLDNVNLKSFNTIQITLRNFTKENKKDYSQIPTLRFFRNKGFRYEGSVHNQPIYQNPVYYEEEIILYHYGYNSEDKVLMQKKYERTKNLLLKELEKEPNNIYYLYQLAQTYNMYGNNIHAYEVIKKAVGLLITKKQKEEYVYIYQKYSNICISLDRYEEAAQISGEGIRINPDYIDLYYIYVLSMVKMGRREEGISFIKKYLELQQNPEKINIYADSSIEIFYVSSSYKDLMLTELITYYLEKEEYSEVLKYLCGITDKYQKNKLMIIYSFSKKDFEFLYQYYITLEKDIEYFQQLMENQLETLEEEEKNDFFQAFSIGNDIYAHLNQVRVQNKLENKRRLLKLLENKINYNNEPRFYLQILKATFEDDPNRFFNILKRVQSSLIRELISKYFTTDDIIRNQISIFLDTKFVRESDFQSNRVYYVIASIVLLDAVEREKSIENKYSLFKRYIENGMLYILTLYNPKVLKLVYKTIDEKEVKLLLVYSLIKDLLEKREYKTVLKLYKEALEIFPSFNKYIVLDIKKLKNIEANS